MNFKESFFLFPEEMLLKRSDS